MRKKNSTPGKEKGENCQASPYDKGMARSNRSHKDKKLFRVVKENGFEIRKI